LTFAYITHPDCTRHEMGPHHPECPDRVSVVHERLLASGLLDFAESFEAPAATIEQLERAHAPSHVLAIRSAAPHAVHEPRPGGRRAGR